MKLNELDKTLPHLYLDMDGVQADFFGHWARSHNVDHYNNIPDKETAINVLAHSSPEEVYKFFRDLPLLSGGHQIIKWLRQHNVLFTVLSAPLRGPYAAASVQAKKDWLDEFNPGTSASAIFTANKQKYALTNGNPNVLVDDFGKYLRAWQDAGGIAIKHDDATTPTTIQHLEKIYL